MCGNTPEIVCVRLASTLMKDRREEIMRILHTSFIGRAAVLGVGAALAAGCVVRDAPDAAARPSWPPPSSSRRLLPHLSR